jgi:hypothetical protein
VATAPTARSSSISEETDSATLEEGVIPRSDPATTRDAHRRDERPTRGTDVAVFHECMDTFDTLPLIVAPLVGILVLLIVAIANLA